MVQVNMTNLIDDGQCYQTVRELRWPNGVACSSCASTQVIKRGFDDTEPGAFLGGAQLQSAFLRRAQLQGVDLRIAKHLSQYRINGVCVDEHTQFPAGLTKPSPCPANP
jgi:hypothetical protein